MEIEYENLHRLNLPFQEQFKVAFEKLLKKGWFVLGEEVERFEEEFAKYCGSRYCVGVASGLDALILSLVASELPRGSEVLVPSNTYIATILSILQAGFKPVLVEPDFATCNIDPARIAEKISSKTAALIVVHLYGRPCDMDPIRAICEANGILLFEDCAQSHGAEYKLQKTGTFGKAGAYSFYPTKNLGALGDGGAIITDDPDLYQQLRSLRNYGSRKKYHNDRVGYNSRLDELQAAFLRIKLPALDGMIDQKRKLASIYLDRINPQKIMLPLMEGGYRNSWHIFNIRHSEREALKTWLEKKGIRTEIHYPIAPYKQKGYEDLFQGQSFPIAEKIHQTTLSLPISNFHTESQIIRVAETVNEFCRSDQRVEDALWKL